MELTTSLQKCQLIGGNATLLIAVGDENSEVIDEHL